MKTLINDKRMKIVEKIYDTEKYEVIGTLTVNELVNEILEKLPDAFHSQKTLDKYKEISGNELVKEVYITPLTRESDGWYWVEYNLDIVNTGDIEFYEKKLAELMKKVAETNKLIEALKEMKK